MSRYSIGPADKDTSKRLLNDVKNGRLTADRAHELLYSGTGGARIRKKGGNKKRVHVQYEAEDSDGGENSDEEEDSSDEGDVVYYNNDRNVRHHHADPIIIKKKKPKQKKEQLAIHKAYKKLIDDGEGTCPLCCSPLRGCVKVMWYCVLLFVGLMCLLVVLGWLMKLFMTIWPWL
jgi:hypothetical protein